MTVFLAGASAASAAGPSRLGDLNPGAAEEDGSIASADQFTSAGPRASFAVHLPVSIGSEELWTSDGTPGGTALVRPFPLTQTRLVLLGSAAGVTFFLDDVPQDSSSIPALWRTDGTEAGTFPLTGPLGSRRNFFFRSFLLGRSLYFTACTGPAGCELWRSDGTREGTGMVRDITPGRFGSNPRDFAAAGGLAYFFANDPAGPGLWRTDGTREGTRRVATLPAYQQPESLTAAGSRLFFLEGPARSSGWRIKNLWVSDGTAAGTRPVAPFDGPTRGRTGVIEIVGSLGGRLFFAAREPVLGPQLWASDGTARGTRRLTEFSQRVPGVELFVTRQNTAVLGDRLFFIGLDDRLWSTRGTRASTQPLTGCPGGCPAVQPFSFPPANPLFSHEGKLYFIGGEPEGDFEPWISDGTAAGTRLLADVCPGECSSVPAFVLGSAGQAYFLARGELWVTDGTLRGTELLADRVVGHDETRPAPMTVAGGRVVFIRIEEETGPEAWATDGTPGGTVFLARLSGSASSKPQSFTAFQDGALFFSCFDHQATLWRSDGTSAGTEPLLSDPIFCSDPLSPIYRLGDTAFFIHAPEDAFWYEVWQTDGTPDGTRRLARVGPEETVFGLQPYGDRLLFLSERALGDPVTSFWTIDGTGTVEKLFELPVRFAVVLDASDDGIFFRAAEQFQSILWYSDGTAAGTRILMPLFNPPSDSVRFGGFLDFLLEGGLWRSDGTPAGTRQVLPNPAAPLFPVNPVGLTQFGGALYFIAGNGSDPDPAGFYPPALFRSDGTAAGTAPLLNFAPDEFGSFPAPHFTPFGGLLYFIARDAAHGMELWRTDGTRGGTHLVRDIAPGPDPAQIGAFTVVAGRLWFAANDGEHGSELWTSDGTAAGTRLAADINPGPASSFPGEITGAGGRIFFAADDGETGREPWVLEVP